MAAYDLTEYQSSMDKLSASLSKDLDSLMAKRAEFSDTAEFRSYLQEQVPALSAKYENAASALAADQYDDWREDILGKAYGAQVSEPDTTRVKKSAYSLSHPLKEADKGNITEGDALEKTKNQLQSMLDRRMKTAGRNTTRDNSRRDDKSTGCAAVPRGATTCAFCLEMAAVGVAESFKILDIEGRTFHDHCNCAFVPGFVGNSVKIDGYDSDAIRDALSDVKRTLGYELNTALTSKLLAEMRKELERRDLDWVMKGIAPKVTLTPGASPNKLEEATANRLRTHGIAVNFEPESGEYLQRMYDYTDRVAAHGWEMKQSRGNGERNINNQLNSNERSSTGHKQPQSDKVVIDISWHEGNPDGLSHSQLINRARAALLEHPEVTEVLLVGDQGFMARITR